MRSAALACVLLVGCFSPSFEDGVITCAQSMTCPEGLVCIDGVCRTSASERDAASFDGARVDAANGVADSGAPDAFPFPGFTLRVNIPCGSSCNGGIGCTSASMVANGTSLTSSLVGTQDLEIRVRGVVETKTYTGGTKDGYWHVGGTDSDQWQAYSLIVEDPAATYRLNSGMSGDPWVVGLDYMQTVAVNPGSSITLQMSDIDNCQLINEDMSGSPIVIAGIPPAPSAFDGQFVQVDVLSATPAP